MKRMLTILTAALIGVAAMAQTKSLEGLTLYVNPGHGGFDSNDRSVWTIPVPAMWSDSAGYWESKSNFVKGVYLKEMLEQAGATVIFSRDRNDSGARDMPEFLRRLIGTSVTSYFDSDNDNRPVSSFNKEEFLQKYPQVSEAAFDSVMDAGGDRYLSAIAAEANANEVDHFLSIHSNAGAGVAGKENYLLMLYRGTDSEPTHKDSKAMATLAAQIQFDNPLTVWQNDKPSVRGDISFYPSDWNGLGVLRPQTCAGHLSEGSFHDYAPETHRLMSKDYCKLEAIRMFMFYHQWFKRDLPDANAPITKTSGVVSGWVKSENEKADVLGEANWYYMTREKNDDDAWLPLNEVTVTLLQGDKVIGTTTTDNWYNGVFAFYDVPAGDYKVAVKKTGYDVDTADVTVKAGEIAATKIKIPNIRLEIEDYADVDIDAGAEALYDLSFVSSGKQAEVNDVVRALLSKDDARNTVFALKTTGEVVMLNAANGVQIGVLPNSENLKFTDIALAADNYPLALSINGDEATVYTWGTLTKDPTVLFTVKVDGQEFLGGMTVAKPHWNANVYLTAKNAIVGVIYNEDGVGVEQTKVLTTDIDLTGAQIEYMPGGSLYVDSKTLMAQSLNFSFTAADKSALTATALALDGEANNAIMHGASFFVYKETSYMTLPIAEADGSKVGFAIADVSKGLDKAVLVSKKYATDGLGTTPATYMTAMTAAKGYEITVYLLAVGEGYQAYQNVQNKVLNIYAGEINYSEKEGFSFRLNEDATAVTLAIELNGAVVGTKELGVMEKGLHTVANPFGSQEFDYIAVTATADAHIAPIRVNDDSTPFQFYAARGVVVDNSPSSAYFGRIYVSNTSEGTMEEATPGKPRKTTEGIYVLGSDFTDVTLQGDKAWDGKVSWGSNSGDAYAWKLSRPSVGPDGKVYVASSAFKSSGLYIMNPSDPSVDFEEFFAGTRKKSTGKITATDKSVMAYQVLHSAVIGEGEDMKLYTMNRVPAEEGGVISHVYQFNIGGKELPWNEKPSAIAYSDDGSSLFQNGNCSLASDGHGGWWISQYRASGKNTAAIPSLVHVTNGKVDHKQFDDVEGSYMGGMGATVDGSRVAIGTESGYVVVFDVTYDSNNVPTMKKAFTIKWGTGSTLGVAFDAVGNLYIVSPSNERLMVYSLPKIENTSTFRSPKTKVDLTPSAIDNIIGKGDIRVYPNPVVDILTVEGEAEAYTVYSLTGGVLLSGEVNAASQIDLSGLNKGVYMLSVKSKDGKKNIVKIIKQ